MFVKMDQSTGDLIGFKVSGVLTDEDYQRVLIPEIQKVINQQGKVRLLWDMEEFHGWDLHAAWDDLIYGFKINKNLSRIAILGDRQWEEWMAWVLEPFAQGELRYFHNSKLEEALEWLKED